MATRNGTYGSTAGLGTLNDADFDTARGLGEATGRDLARAHGTGTGDLMKNMDLDSVKREISGLREQLDKFKLAAKGGAGRVDTHVHVSPYPYVLGAFGLGLLAGSLLFKRPTV